jgi:predicted transglutaminase-like cysteine proteinase
MAQLDVAPPPFAPISAGVISPLAQPVPPQEWSRLLRRVNDRVNARVHQQSDLATYGVPELWRPSGDGPRAAGDCEDLALEKRVELIAADFPPERLFLAVVYRSDVGLHTVLVARLDEGDVVLDSRVGFIEHWSRAGYSWLSVEAPGQPMVWRAVA